MKKFKLLKDWTDPASKEVHKAGTIISTEDMALAGKLLVDGIADRFVETPALTEKQIKDTVNEAVASALKDSVKPSVQKSDIHIETKDRSDEDPSAGYLPNGKAKSKSEVLYGLGLFAKDVMNACTPNGKASDRLLKQRSRMEERLNKGVADGHIDKSAADGYLARWDSDGGFLIPPEFSLALMDAKLEDAVIRPRARIISLSTMSIALPQWKNYNHQTYVYGGMLAYMKGENVQLSSLHGQLEEIKLELNPLTIMSAASHQIIRFSAIDVGSWLLPQMAKTLAWKEDDLFMNGTGGGQPLGITNAPATISIAIESGQTLSNGPIVTKNVLKMRQALRTESKDSVAWIYNQTDLLVPLCMLTLPVGTAGMPAGLVTLMSNAPEMKLLGHDLLDTEHAQAAGTVGDIMLCDLSQYLIADDRGGMDISSSAHLYFDYGQMAYRIISYVDGQPRYKSAFTRQRSTNTMSGFVNLAARA